MADSGLVKLKSVRIYFASILLLLLSLPAAAFDVNVVPVGSEVSFSAADADVKYMSVVVWGPDGATVFSQVSNGENLTWLLSGDQQDGRYKYEVKLSDVAPGSRTRGQAGSSDGASSDRVSTRSGSVMIESGGIVPAIDEESLGLFSPLETLVKNIAILSINAIMPSAHADNLIADDVIVGGSLCVGLDCIDGEDFNFDTVRLKENNLRIHFQDTSVSAAFPTTDWRIIINDSTNGGQSYFSIEDATAGLRPLTLEAGAPANSLYVGANGRVGFGTSNPVTSLEAVGGNTPTLRLNQDGSQGFMAQSWDLGGNEDGFFLRDATNGSSLPFQLAPGAPTDAVYIASSGNVGLGLNDPTEKLHVVGNAIISGNLELGSSRTIKNHIRSLDLGQARSTLQELEPVMFKYNHSPDEQAIGFIAEDVPELVATRSRKSLKPMDIVAVLTKVVQDQQKTIEELSAKVDALSTAAKGE